MLRIGTLWSKLVLRFKWKAVRNSNIDKSAWIHYGSNIVNSQIGRYSYCGYDCWIINTQIGSFCSIGANVRIGGAAHPMEWVSTSPVFQSGENVLKKHFSEHHYKNGSKTFIENDVWIGDQALIKSGVTIGNGAVIGMGSVVTKNVGPYEIWAGNPAKKIGARFDDELSERLLESKWWEMPDEELTSKAKDMMNPENFLRNLK